MMIGKSVFNTLIFLGDDVCENIKQEEEKLEENVCKVE